MIVKKKKIKEGKVVSNKMNKTIVVLEERKITHPLYKKSMKRSKKFKAHDENNFCNIGDVVKIEETRPLSKEKRWRLLEVTKRAVQEE